MTSRKESVLLWCWGAVAAIVLLTAGCAQAPPPWVTTHVHPDFAEAQFVVGIGSCPIADLPENEYREAAQRRAYAEIATQIRSRVTAESHEATRSIQEDSRVRSESAFLAEKLLTSSERLEGARIADVYLDGSGDVYYVLAVLDVRAFSQNLSARVRQSMRERSTRRVHCQQARAKRDWGATLQHYAELATLAKEIDIDLALLRVLDAASARAIAESRGYVISDPAVDFAIKLSCVSGGEQRGVPGQRLDEPLTLAATVAIFGEEGKPDEPVPGIPIVASAGSHEGVFDHDRVVTDAKGQATFSVKRLPRGVGAAQVEFSLQMPDGGFARFAKRLTLRIPVVNRENARIGLAVTLRDRDRQGRAWVMERLSTGLAPLGRIRKSCFLSSARDTDRALEQLGAMDLVLFADLSLDILVLKEQQEFFSSEARLRLSVWLPHASTWLWSGREVKARGSGEEALEATEQALISAMALGVGDVRNALTDLFQGGVTQDGKVAESGAVSPDSQEGPQSPRYAGRPMSPPSAGSPDRTEPE